MGSINDKDDAFSLFPEHGFSLFLANRTKTIHFIRHGEGYHNVVNREAGDDTPVTFSTPNAWNYIDARLTPTGIEQCITARDKLLANVEPELIVVSPFTRTLQTAHAMFGGKGIKFMVHFLCKERAGKFTCDKMRTKTEILADMLPIYEYTNDNIDTQFGFRTEEDQEWSEEREPSEKVVQRGIDFVQWLASRPEKEIAVVSHSSFLKHLFRSFGDQVADKDTAKMHRLSGNAEVRSIVLALHKGFYPEGEWNEFDDFVPANTSFRYGRWAPSNKVIAKMHAEIAKKAGTES